MGATRLLDKSSNTQGWAASRTQEMSNIPTVPGQLGIHVGVIPTCRRCWDDSLCPRIATAHQRLKPSRKGDLPA